MKGPTKAAPAIIMYIALVAGMRVLIKLSGFAEKMVMTYFFDLRCLDVYTVAFSIPLMTFITMTAFTNPVILPLLVRRIRTGNPAAAWAVFHAWLLLATAVLIPLAVVGAFHAEWLAGMLAPGFDAERKALCADMMRILIPACAVYGMFPIFASMLNAERRFTFPPLAEAAVKWVHIAAIVGCAGFLNAYVLAWGTAAGLVAGGAMLAGALLLRWRAAGPAFRDPAFHSALLLLGAPLVGEFFARGSGLFENAMLSQLDAGAVAAVELAKKLVNLPLLIIPLAASTVLFTIFSELNQTGNHKDAARLSAQAVRAMVFLFLPIAMLAALLAQPITAVVYMRGSFDASDLVLVSSVLRWLSPYILLIAVEMILMQFFFSQGDLWTPYLTGAGCVAVRILIIFALLPRLGLAAVLLALVATRILKAFLLMLLLARRGQLHRTDWAPAGFLRLLPGTAAGASFAWFAVRLAAFPTDAPLPHRVALLSIAGGGAAALYFAGGLLCRCEEAHYIWRRLPWNRRAS